MTRNITVLSSSDRKLAIELELYAVEKQTSEVQLVRRYIAEGLRRDKGQTTLDE